jgi:hypothetical protein
MVVDVFMLYKAPAIRAFLAMRCGGEPGLYRWLVVGVSTAVNALALTSRAKRVGSCRP